MPFCCRCFVGLLAVTMMLIVSRTPTATSIADDSALLALLAGRLAGDLLLDRGVTVPLPCCRDSGEAALCWRLAERGPADAVLPLTGGCCSQRFSFPPPALWLPNSQAAASTGDGAVMRLPPGKEDAIASGWKLMPVDSFAAAALTLCCAMLVAYAGSAGVTPAVLSKGTAVVSACCDAPESSLKR